MNTTIFVKVFKKLFKMKNLSLMTFIIFIHILFISCSSNSMSDDKDTLVNSNNDEAKIVSISTSGIEHNYTFNVGISSPDKGCNQYANWWEVISNDSDLIYRRILGHSHVNEQPFTRSGGAVDIKEDQIVIIRVHMNTTGYSSKTFKGSIKTGFKEFTTAKNFAPELANQAPLPSGCAF